MSAKNQAKIITIHPPAPKEQEDFLHRCDKLYLHMIQNIPNILNRQK